MGSRYDVFGIRIGYSCTGPMWAVEPSTEHKKTPRITQNGQPRTGAQMAAENVKILLRAHASPTQTSKGGWVAANGYEGSPWALGG
eukprot:1999956-Prymnesium_polylepis.1